MILRYKTCTIQSSAGADQPGQPNSINVRCVFAPYNHTTVQALYRTVISRCRQDLACHRFQLVARNLYFKARSLQLVIRSLQLVSQLIAHSFQLVALSLQLVVHGFFRLNVRSPSFAGVVNSTGKFNSIIVKTLKPVFYISCPFNLKKGTMATRQFISTDHLSLLSTPLTSRWTIPLT